MTSIEENQEQSTDGSNDDAGKEQTDAASEPYRFARAFDKDALHEDLNRHRGMTMRVDSIDTKKCIVHASIDKGTKKFVVDYGRPMRKAFHGGFLRPLEEIVRDTAPKEIGVEPHFDDKGEVYFMPSEEDLKAWMERIVVAAKIYRERTENKRSLAATAGYTDNAFEKLTDIEKEATRICSAMLQDWLQPKRENSKLWQTALIFADGMQNQNGQVPVADIRKLYQKERDFKNMNDKMLKWLNDDDQDFTLEVITAGQEQIYQLRKKKS